MFARKISASFVNAERMRGLTRETLMSASSRCTALPSVRSTALTTLTSRVICLISSGRFSSETCATIVIDDFSGGKNGKIYVDAIDGPVTFWVRNGYSHIKGFEIDAVQGSANAIAAPFPALVTEVAVSV